MYACVCVKQLNRNYLSPYTCNTGFMQISSTKNESCNKYRIRYKYFKKTTQNSILK